MGKIWSSMKGYEDVYAISMCGKVWSYKRSPWLKSRVMKTGYEEVGLSKKGKRKSATIHRLLAGQYLGKIKGFQINHKDGNKLNNTFLNLEICTASENGKHAYATGLKKKRLGVDHPRSIHKEDKIRMIKKMITQGFGNKYIADLLRVRASAVSDIRRKKIWTHVSI